jgi:hypothetical protein
MARLSLHRDEAFARRLPALCMACGRPSQAAPSIRMPYYPLKQAVIYAIPAFFCLGCFGVPFWFLIAFGMRKTVAIDVPLCERHQNYFTVRLLLYWSIASLSIIVPILGAVAALLIARDVEPDVVGMIFVYAVLGAAGLGIVLIARIRGSSLRATEITATEITLTQVDDDFVDAYREQRRRWAEEDAERDLPVAPKQDAPGPFTEHRESFRERRTTNLLRDEDLEDS